MTLQKPNARQGHGQRHTTNARRRRLGRALSRKIQLEKLEDRRLLTATPNYWSEDGSFDQSYIGSNYVNSANIIQGFTATQPGQENLPGVFAQMSTADLYSVDDLPRDIQGRVKLSTFYLADDALPFDTETFLEKSEIGKSTAYLPNTYYKQGTPEQEMWLTPFNSLREYMNSSEVKAQWTSQLSPYENRDPSPSVNPTDPGTIWSNYTEATSPYNRAAAALGMLNGKFLNDSGTILGGTLGFGNFYRVADVWVDPQHLFHTSADSDYASTEVIVPGGVGATTTPVDIGTSWTPVQQVEYGEFSSGVAQYYASPNYQDWYERWWSENTVPGLFPWTGHGYTYDWYYGYSEEQYNEMLKLTPEGTWATRGLTEYVLAPGAPYEVGYEAELQDYLANQDGVSVSEGALTIELTDNADHDLKIIREGDHLRVSDSLNPLVAGARTIQDGRDILIDISRLATSADITFNGGDADDSLTIDFNGGDFNFAAGITFNGGDSSGAIGDLLTIVGGFNNQTLNYTTTDSQGNNGNVELDGFMVSYTGLEPINAGTSVDTILNLPAAFTNTATIQDDPTPGSIRIVDNGATFENTTIPNPSSTLTVNLGNQGDALFLESLDPASTASILINGGISQDRITLDVPTSPGTITVTGGNPIATDTLIINTATNARVTQGADSPTGLIDQLGIGTDKVNYRDIEAIQIESANVGSMLTILGTNGSDTIAVAPAGSATTIWVNAGPTITANLTNPNLTSINIEGKAGDDTFSITPLTEVTLNIDGGVQTTNDSLTVLGTTDSDLLLVSPSGIDAAVVTLDGRQPLNVTTTDNLTIDGLGNDDQMVVLGGPNDNSFVHLPGIASDAGRINTTDETDVVALLGIDYRNLGDGTLGIDGASGLNSLTVMGTTSSDYFEFVSPNPNEAQLIHRDANSSRPIIATLSVNQYTIDATDGDDVIDISSPILADGLNIDGGGSSGQDVLVLRSKSGTNDDLTIEVDPLYSSDQIVAMGSTSTTDVSVYNVGSIQMIAEDDDTDTLTINLGNSDDTAVIQRSHIIDETLQSDIVLSSSLPDIQYTGFALISLDAGFGTDTFEIYPTHLTGAQTLTVNGGGITADDALLLVGTETNDTVTSTIDTVTMNSVAVTIGNNNFAQLTIDTLGGQDNVTLALELSGVHKVVKLGAGDDQLDASLMQDGDFFGGIGDDSIIGTPLADRIFGGDGNDLLVGGDGIDFIYGEAGNDTIGDATPGADDAGDDFYFGGDGSDLFIWEPGDGQDTISGGDDGDDRFDFRGNGIDGDQFDLTADDAHVDAIYNSTTVNQVAGVEHIHVTPTNGGAAIVTVDDLFTTETTLVEIDLPTTSSSGDADSVIVEGRNTADDLNLDFRNGTVVIEGLTYDVMLSGSTTEDTLTLNLNDGSDSTNVSDSVSTLVTSVLNGGSADDLLTGNFNTANGDTGNDTIRGSVGVQVINGGPGEDTMLGGDAADTFDGGADFDTILIPGTSGNDVIDVLQSTSTTLNHTVNGDIQVDTLVANTVEQARIEAASGADLIRVNWQDGVMSGLQMTIDGGEDTTFDRLIVVDDASNDLVLYRKGIQDDSGTVEIGPINLEPLLAVFDGIERIDFVDDSGTNVNEQLVVFKHDPFESNDSRFNATYLGSGHVLNLDPTIDPGPVSDPFGDGQSLSGDRDFYRVVAETTGTMDFQIYFREVAGLPNNGNLDIYVRDANGNIINGFGINDGDDDERVRIPVVEGQTYYLEVFGNNGNAINVYDISIINHAPTVPYALELMDNPADGAQNPPGTSVNSDTGRSQYDNITYDDTPTLFFRLDDGIFLNDIPGNSGPVLPPDQMIPIPFQAGTVQPVTAGYAIAIFDQGDTLPQTGTAPQTPLGFATATGQEGVYSFTVPGGGALSEGSHFLTARVQMIAASDDQQTAFGSRSLPLEIIVDTTPPRAFFGLAGDPTDGIHPDSDHGSIADGITNDVTPTFFGRADADSIIRLYVDLDDSSTLSPGDLLIAQTTTLPLDGTAQLDTPMYPNEPGGQWVVTSDVSMNDPRIVSILGKDGVRRVLLSAEDVAGNITPNDEVQQQDILIDTTGPQVTGVFITSKPTFDLFTLKPETPQPTPAVYSLTISLQDLPPRVAPFFYGVLANEIEDHELSPIVLRGDHNGAIAIEKISYNDLNAGPGIATAEIVLDFSQPLPDDRYTLTLTDDLVDLAGNPLDGQNNAAEPNGTPDFPTGDAIPGGNFIARFTVDSRPEVATWSQSVIYADINGNYLWDPQGKDNDATNRDFVYNFGELTDAYFAGNFSQNAIAGPDGIIGTDDDTSISPDNAISSGFDKPGAYGAFNGSYQFYLDTDDNGVGDLVGNMFYQVNAIPLAGNFFQSAADDTAMVSGERPRDEIGGFDGQYLYLDVNGNNSIDNGERFATGLRGNPMVGDFNGDGVDDLATYNNDTGVFTFNLVSGYSANGPTIVGNDQLTFGFSGFGEIPVSGDINLDGVDDIAMWVPGRQGQTPSDAGEFHILVSDSIPASPVATNLPSNVFGPYSPAPLGNDLFSTYGTDVALPLIGNFDPPIESAATGRSLGSLTNQHNPFDATRDGNVSALDALVVINAIQAQQVDYAPNANLLRVVASMGGHQLDVSQDGKIAVIDALLVINAMEISNAESEQVPNPAPIDESAWPAATEQVFEAFGNRDDEDELMTYLCHDLQM